MNTNTLPRKFPRKLLLGGAGAVALIAIAAGGGYAVTAGDDDQPIPAGDRERAEDAALSETGGGTVTDAEMDDEQSKYEVEVTLDDGTQVDVQLDDSFGVVSTETDGPEDGDDDGDDNNADDRALSPTERDRAERAALAETGGGTVTSTEADDGNGYEVEVTRDDGTEVDVRLDQDFDVVSAHTDGPDDDHDDDHDND
ncbi:PepSY domain-containing protein [Nocardioides pelophilus]|uniref:PepSY domain-containing protein n=1 Tax=Nocardioides pelophilus TaxID=2172019 RepID=UPI001C7E61D9|nr:PepSY domain-containing protein [Nocardioides pelophilus]